MVPPRQSRALTVVRDIPYVRDGHSRHVGDLFPSLLPNGSAVVLLIHGGAWSTMAKEAVEPIAQMLCEGGWHVFSVNYRLIGHVPWPACMDDVATAGGHLAMMAGATLPATSVKAIISIAGPSRLDPVGESSGESLFSSEFHRRFFGTGQVTQPQLDRCSPVAIVRPNSPPLVCIHSRNDKLVPISHSHAAVNAWRAAGASADLVVFDGPGEAHGLWDRESGPIRRPVPAFAESLMHGMQIVSRLTASR